MDSMMMNKTEAIAAVIDATDHEPVIWTTGYASRIARGLRDRDSHFYMTGSMGLAASIGTGLAMELERPVVVVEGDGSLLMNPASLIAAGTIDDLPLVHVVLDDGLYASTGGQAVPSRRVDLAGWARHAGYAAVAVCDDVAGLRRALEAALDGGALPAFVLCALVPDPTQVPPRIAEPCAELTGRMRRHLAGAGEPA
jgi:sulfopyruvate decarboxylase subunit beta